MFEAGVSSGATRHRIGWERFKGQLSLYGGFQQVKSYHLMTAETVWRMLP